MRILRPHQDGHRKFQIFFSTVIENLVHLSGAHSCFPKALFSSNTHFTNNSTYVNGTYGVIAMSKPRLFANDFTSRVIVKRGFSHLERRHLLFLFRFQWRIFLFRVDWSVCPWKCLKRESRIIYGSFSVLRQEETKTKPNLHRWIAPSSFVCSLGRSGNGLTSSVRHRKF